MPNRNQTVVTEFVLVGFPSSTEIHFLLFAVFSAIHIVTITANMLIIVIVRLDGRLRSIPMYIFLCHFSFLEIWYTTVTVPKMLVDLLSESRRISFNGCVTQIYFFFALGLTELFLLSAMAYDRYIAICHPLRYKSIMSSSVCTYLHNGSLICGFLTGFCLVIPVSTLSFCGSNSVDHFFCDFVALLNISCREIYVSDLLIFSLTWTIILSSLLMTMVSYFYIIRTVWNIAYATGRWKTFSTCASHLTVLLIFYGTVVFMYARPTSRYSFAMDKVVSVFYVVVTPLLNPMVYTLRNMEFREALRKALTRNRIFCHRY